MAKKYLDQVGLQYLWGKITAADATEATARAEADTALGNRVKTIEDSIGEGGSVAEDIAQAQADIDALEALVGSDSVADQIDDAITDLDLANTYAGKAYEGKVDTLIDSDTNKSVRTIANEELAAQLIPENAATDLNELHEIAAWIQSHPGDAATMNAAITDLQAKTELGTDADDTEYATVKAYVEAEIAKVNGDASTLAGRVSTNETNIGALQTSLGTSADEASASGATAWSRIADNQARLTAVEGRATALETRAATIEGRLGTADDTASASGTTAWSRLKNVESLVGATSVATQISTAVQALDADLDATGTPANGGVFVVSGVTEVDGILTAVDSVEVDAAGAAATAKSQVIGADGDASNANTVFGAKKYADEVAEAATAALNTSEIDAACSTTPVSGD